VIAHYTISTFEKKPFQKISQNQLLTTLKQNGVVLLRGYDFDANSFQSLSEQLCDKFHHIASRYTLQNKQQGDGYSVEVFRENFELLGHAEATYTPFFSGHSCPPEVCFFMCITPPTEQGGETTLVDGCEFLKRLDSTVQQKLEKSGIIYHMVWEKTRWQHEFQLEDTQSLSNLLDKLNSVKYKLRADDSLALHYSTPAITQTLDGKLAFATGLLAHLPAINHPHYQHKMVFVKPSNQISFGDGEEISAEVINHLIDIHDELLYKHCWQAHDVLIVDNTRFLHGRTMTEKPCKRVLLSRFGWLRAIT